MPPPDRRRGHFSDPVLIRSIKSPHKSSIAPSQLPPSPPHPRIHRSNRTMGHCDKEISLRLLDPVPPGRWGVAVSGGADSVALLSLAVRHPSIEPVAIHLDHETRQGQSTEDAAFVATLCQTLGVPLVSSRLSEIEAEHPMSEPNRSARFRAARHALFAKSRASGICKASSSPSRRRPGRDGVAAIAPRKRHHRARRMQPGHRVRPARHPPSPAHGPSQWPAGVPVVAGHDLAGGSDERVSGVPPIDRADVACEARCSQ